jgi:hypothetical protein
MCLTFSPLPSPDSYLEEASSRWTEADGDVFDRIAEIRLFGELHHLVHHYAKPVWKRGIKFTEEAETEYKWI